MGSDNKQTIRQMYDAFSKGDIDGLLGNVTDDFKWHSPGASPFAGERHGRDQMREYFAEMQRWVRLDQFDVDDVLADGDKVVVLGRERGTVRETGRHFETRFAHVFTLRSGKVASGQVFADTHAIASAFGESTAEREALTGPLGVTHPAFSGRGTPE